MKGMGSNVDRVARIKAFLDRTDVIEYLGAESKQDILRKDPSAWLQTIPLVIDFANSG